MSPESPPELTESLEDPSYRQIAEKARGQQLHKKRQALNDAINQVWTSLTHADESPDLEDLQKLQLEATDLLYFLENDLTDLVDGGLHNHLTEAEEDD